MFHFDIVDWQPSRNNSEKGKKTNKQKQKEKESSEEFQE